MRSRVCHKLWHRLRWSSLQFVTYHGMEIRITSACILALRQAHQMRVSFIWSFQWPTHSCPLWWRTASKFSFKSESLSIRVGKFSVKVFSSFSPPAPSQFARPTFGVPLSVSEAAFITSVDLLFSSFSEGKPGKFVSSRWKNWSHRLARSVQYVFYVKYFNCVVEKLWLTLGGLCAELLRFGS